MIRPTERYPAGTSAAAATPGEGKCVIHWSGIGQEFIKDGAALPVLGRIDLKIMEGEFLALLGPSGCGKSTLLNITAGTLKPTRGECIYRGERTTTVNTKVGYLSQSDNLLPWRTVLGNVVLALEIRGEPKRSRVAKARDYIAMVDLEGFENHYPNELSGGMRKRVALIRTLIYDPETLLMDEPFGALDAQLRAALHEEVLGLWTGSGKTIIFVTHDLQEAITLADRIVVMSRAPGEIRHIHPVPLPRPRDPYMGMLGNEQAARLGAAIWADLGQDVDISNATTIADST